MKKFFKGLALVLALVLVLGTIPASNASAKVYTKKTLYLNGGSAKKNTAKLYKLAGVKKADAAKVTAESADSKIVKAGSKKLTAKAEGKVDVKISVDGKLVTTVTVTVKDLAKPAEVELKAQSVKQTASNAIRVIFNKEVEKMEKSDFNVYYTAGDAKVYGNVVSSVKQNADDKKAWDVVFFSNFAPKESYFVEVTGIELPFTTAGNTYKDVASIKLAGPSTVTVGETSKKFSVKYFNEAGIDITASVDEGKFNVVMNAEGLTDGYFSQPTIYFWTVGATAVVKVKVEQLNDKYEYVTVGEDSMAVTCVSKAERTYAGVNCWTFAAPNASRIKENAAASNINQNIAVGDSKAFQVVFNTLTGTEKGYENVTVANNYEFESANPAIALVTYTDSKSSPVVYGVAAGDTYIKIYAIDTVKDTKTLITAVPVTVKPSRVATTVTPKWSKANLNVDATVADSVELSLEVKDQYGDKINAKNIKIWSEQNYLTTLGGFPERKLVERGSINTLVATSSAIGVYKTTFGPGEGVSYVKNGTYTATVQVDDVKLTVSLPVASYVNTTAKDGIQLAAVKSYDTSLTAQTKYDDAFSTDMIINNISINKTKGGFYLGGAGTIEFRSAVPQRATGDAFGYVYTVAKNGQLLDGTQWFVDTTNHNFKLFTLDGGKLKKADAGKYVVTAYEVKNAATMADSYVKAVDSKSFDITDAQVKPSFVQVEGEYEGLTSVSDFEDVFEACIVPVFNGKQYDDWDAARAEGYDYVLDADDYQYDVTNNTIVFLNVDFIITNMKSGSTINGQAFEISNVTVGKYVHTK